MDIRPIPFVFAFLVTSAAFGAIELGTPFSDGAVLQRGMKVPVWGTISAPHSFPLRVTVSFAGQKKSALTNGVTGQWRVDLDPLEASSEGRTLTVVEESGTWRGRLFGSAADTVEIRDVVVGEVWFASGQSNMECPIWGDRPRYRDFTGALMTSMTRLPLVRYAKVKRDWSAVPKKQRTPWKPFLPESFAGDGNLTLSALAFYYARELHLALGIPVGIVDASWGGTNIDAWTPRCGYTDCSPRIRKAAEYPVKGADWKKPDGPWTIYHDPQQQPTVLFNAMVSAWTPMAMRGFIWYQGCHNNSEAEVYDAKMHALYKGWSRAFENPGLKLYFAQLAPFTDNWMKLVASQNRFAAEEPNAAIAVTADVGNFTDIHPNRKEIVARRLAVHALKRDYGFPIAEDESPVLKSATFRAGQATLVFDHVKSWYAYDPDFWHEPPFELAGTNGVWHAATLVNEANRIPWQCGEIKGKGLILKAKDVPEPVRVRYMGRPKTMGDLFNEASLPLGPFETPYPAGTENRQVILPPADEIPSTGSSAKPSASNGTDMNPASNTQTANTGIFKRLIPAD